MSYRTNIYKHDDNIITIKSGHRLLVTIVTEDNSNVISLEGIVTEVFQLFNGIRTIDEILKMLNIPLDNQEDEQDFLKMLQFCVDNKLIRVR